LPLLDVRQEVAKATDVARLREWHEFVESKQADVDRIRNQERGPGRVSRPIRSRLSAEQL
jgi:hypothetical protein